MHLLQKIYFEQYVNNAESIDEISDMTIYLEKGKHYYIVFEIDYTNCIYFVWSEFVEENKLTINYNQIPVNKAKVEVNDYHRD